MRSKLFYLLVAGLIALSIPVFAQVALRTGSVYGKLIDESGAPLPGVNVTLESDLIPAQVATTGVGGAFRFAALPPGTYALSFVLSGFTEIRQEDVRVTTGAEVQLEIKMKPELGEQVIVTAETPLVDTRKSGNDSTFIREYLEDVPTGRDPWVIIEQTPGVTTDRYNVGGTQSGQQSEFTARGASSLTTVWNFDGVNLTDPFALGGTTYMDFNTFEEVQISTGGNDASIGSAGVAINIVTRRGGNKWTGNASYYFVNDSLQSENMPDEAVQQGLTRTDAIDEIKDWGFDLGGPVIKDRLFVWGAIQKSEISIFKTESTFDFSELKNKAFKAHVNPAAAHESYFQYTSNDKIKLGRVETPSPGTSDTLLDQLGPTNILDGLWVGGHTWMPNDRTIITGRYSYWGLGFSLNARGGTDKPMIYLVNAPYWESTYTTIAPIDRPGHNVNVEGSYFKEQWAGGDHEFRFGFQYQTARQNSEVKFGNGVYLYELGQTTPGGPLMEGYIFLLAPLITNSEWNTTGVYFSDTYRRGRWTFNLGGRFDRSTGTNTEAIVSVPAELQQYLSTVDFKGNDPGITWTNFSPRIGATYDVKGDGKMVIRGNFARYYNGWNPSVHLFSNPTSGFGGAYAAYVNSNGDRSITNDEIVSPFGYFGAYANGPVFDIPGFLNLRKYDPDLSAPWTNEILAGIETELMADFSIGVTYTYRKYGNFEMTVPLGVSTDDYAQATTFTRTTALGTFTVPVYMFTGTDTGIQYYTNSKDFTQTYNGLDVTFRKRMSNNFMLNGTFLLQDQKSHYDGGDSLGVTFTGVHNVPFDPTAVEFIDGQPYAYRSGRSGKTGIFQFAKWQLKVGGVYQFPWDFSVGAFLRYQQGYPFVLTGRVTDTTFPVTYGAIAHTFPVEAFGTRRYENVTTLDMKLQKNFMFGDYGKLSLQLDLFNITNTNVILQRISDTASSSLNRIREVFSPRAVRFGVRYSY